MMSSRGGGRGRAAWPMGQLHAVVWRGVVWRGVASPGLVPMRLCMA